MKNLQIIIEFNDCIIQGKDLLNYEIIVDEDEKRISQMQKRAALSRQGLPNKGLIEGFKCSPVKVAQKADGIIKENMKVAVGLQMSAQRVNQVKSFVKSSAANVLVLRNTKRTLTMINRAQRENKPQCAQLMKT